MILLDPTDRARAVVRDIVVAAAVALFGCPAAEEEIVALDALALADPLSGSAGAAFGQPQTFVGATTPFGLVKLGPDTSGELPRAVGGFAHTSGYWYLDGYIDGFSHLHLSGTGIEDLGNFLVMPTLAMSESKIDEDGYRQQFRHATEEATPGRYAVTLDDTGIRAELSATPHAGIHRYRFPAGAAEPALILDVSHGIGAASAPDAGLRYEGEGVFSGFMENAGRFTGEARAFPVFVSMEVTPVPEDIGGWSGTSYFTSAADLPLRGGNDGIGGVGGVGGDDVGLFARFAPGTEEVIVRVGVSLLDEAQARAHRRTLAGRDFDDVTRDARAAWQDWLGRLRIQTPDARIGRIFTTSLYRSALMPTRYSEPDASVSGRGRYRGLDRAVHDDEGVDYYSDLSLWDTYRTAHPLYALIAPRLAASLSTSLLRMSEQSGALPRWPLAVNETGTMLGSPGLIALADAWLRDARDFDVEQALRVGIDDATSAPGKTSREGHDRCVAAGFCPREEVGRGVAHAAEWGAADFALANLLRAHGRSAEAARFFDQSRVFLGHLDDASAFARGRSLAGGFDPPDAADLDPFDPTAFLEDYAEGNAWHYTFAAPFLAQEMAERLGKDRLLAQIEMLFDEARRRPPRYLSDEWRQPDLFYWHGNEPDLHAAFFPLLLGEPDATARHLRWILETKYDDTPLGLDGNDDGGTLSSWYVLASLGLFPLPGSDLWLCVPPILERAQLAREGGALDIVVERESPASMYLHGLWLDERPLDRAWLRHQELAGARRLRFRLGNAPAGFGRGVLPPLLPAP